MKPFDPKKIISYLRSSGIVATLILITFMTLVSVLFAIRINRVTEEKCYSELTASTAEARSGLESNFRSDRINLRMLAKMLAEEEGLSSVDSGGMLMVYDVNSLISELGILTPENEIIRFRGLTVDADGIMDFWKEVEYGEHISALQPSVSSPDVKVIRSFVPIRQNNTPIGVLYAEMRPANIAKMWSPEIYGGNASFCIIDRSSGEFIVNSWEAGQNNIRDLGQPQLTSEIINGESGFMRLDRGNGTYISYMPMDIEDWEIAVAVDEETVFAEAGAMHRSLRNFLIVQALLFLAYLTFMLYTTRRSIANTEKQANMDALTGLQNRNRYEEFVRAIGKKTNGLSCFYIDANGLHELNNSRGHLAGDQMLRFMADALKVAFGEETVYRIGGDEFVVFQYGKTFKELRKKMRQVQVEMVRNDYHASSGLCMFDEVSTVKEMIKTAEERMYASKKRYYDEHGLDIRSSSPEEDGEEVGA